MMSKVASKVIIGYRTFRWQTNSPSVKSRTG